MKHPVVTRELLELISRGGGVKRYHNEPVSAQTVGHHSFGVAWFCWLLCTGKPSAELLYAAIQHDLVEGVVGDIPAPTKRAIPGLKTTLDKYEAEILTSVGIPAPEIDEHETRLLKFADVFEGILFCVGERFSGNRSVDNIFSKYASYADQMTPTGKALEILTTLKEIYSDIS